MPKPMPKKQKQSSPKPSQKPPSPKPSQKTQNANQSSPIIGNDQVFVSQNANRPDVSPGTGEEKGEIFPLSSYERKISQNSIKNKPPSRIKQFGKKRTENNRTKNKR